MSSEPPDDLAQFRARRDRERRGPPDSSPDPTSLSVEQRQAEQRQAIARAREAWNLRRQGGKPPDDADLPPSD